MLLTLQQYVVLDKLCESILNVSVKICFTAIINERGRTLQSKNRMGIIGCMASAKQDMFFMEYALRQKMRKEYDDDFGSVRYSYAEREKEVLFTFPLYDHLIIVACSNGVDPISFSRKIISIIDECKVQLVLKTSIDNTSKKITRVVNA